MLQHGPEHGLFDAAREDPAAQQEVLDEQHPRLAPQQHHADQAVVPEPVGGLDREHPRRRVLVQRPHLGGLQPARGEVELIGAQCELGDPVEPGRVHGRERHGDVQLPQIAVEGVEGVQEVLPGPLLAVACRAGPVLRGEGPHVEPPVPQQPFGMEGGLPAHLEHRDAGQFAADESALEGAVVDEDEAVRAQIQVGRELGEILVFGPPVGPHLHEVLLTQREFGVFAQSLQNRFPVVLADGGQQYPLGAQLLRHRLEAPERLPAIASRDLDPLGSRLTEHTAPHGVVQVQGEHLLRSARRLPRQMADLAGVSGQQPVGQMRLGVHALPYVVGGDPLREQRVEIHGDHLGPGLHQAQQTGVGLPPYGPEPGPRAEVDELRGQ